MAAHFLLDGDEGGKKKKWGVGRSGHTEGLKTLTYTHSCLQLSTYNLQLTFLLNTGECEG